MTLPKTTKRWTGLAICCLLMAIALAPTQSRALDTSGPPVVVGRIYSIEGDLLRYVPETKDWVAVVKDAPFGTEDTLYSGGNGMAELILPNETWIRIGNDTQIQFIDLGSDITEADVASGVARLYNKSDSAVIKTTSDFGYVLADPGAVYDFYVGANSVEVLPIKGKVTFVHATSNASYDTEPGQPSILADRQQVSSGESLVDADWDRWNAAREDFWARRTRIGRPSDQYLPVPLRYDACVLQEQGRWDRVPYEGSERLFWHPTHVDRGWTPFTAGRWTEWHGDQVWVPNEPFGYMTHHYGNWVLVGSAWYWAPPVTRVRVGLPMLDVGFSWNPGRVSWIHRDEYVGWVPLAPRETYYGHRNWGDRFEVVVTGANFHVALNIGSYAYARHAVVIRQQDYWHDNDYRRARVRDINNTTIINNYYAAPVVNNTVINNYSTNNQRYSYTNTTVSRKPHDTVIRRIDQNDDNIRHGKREKPGEIKQRMRDMRKGQPNREVRIDQPRVVDYMVSAKEVNRPKSEVKFQEKQIRGKGKGREGRHAIAPVGYREQEQPQARREVEHKDLKPPRGENKEQSNQIRRESDKPGPDRERVKPPHEKNQGQHAQPSTSEEVKSPRGNNRKEQSTQPGGRPDKPGPDRERMKGPREKDQKHQDRPSGETEKAQKPKGNPQDQSAIESDRTDKTMNEKVKGGKGKADQADDKGKRGESGGEEVKGRPSNEKPQDASEPGPSPTETQKSKGGHGKGKPEKNSR